AEVVGRSGEMPTLSDGFITQDFILLILLVVFTKGLYDLDKDFFEEHQRIDDYDWVEFFADNANCTACIRKLRLKGAKFDLKCHKASGGHKSNYMDINSSSGFILCIIFLLKCKPNDFLAWVGIKCSSWTSMNKGTSARSACSSTGNCSMPSVLEANRMLERTSLLLLLIAACGGVFGLEQPGNSVLEFYPSFRFVITRLIEVDGVSAVRRAGWWMKHWGARTAKRQYAYSNSATITRLDRGKLTRQPNSHAKVQTATKYHDARGIVRYKGTAALKQTENLACMWFAL
ncbi:unnamed protein product, partial [Durusdinium trenchii]